MLELAKLIHSQQENDVDVVITDRYITLDRTMLLYGEMTFKNCDFEIAPHSDSRFILEEDASVTFEYCRFENIVAPESKHLLYLQGKSEVTDCTARNVTALRPDKQLVGFHKNRKHFPKVELNTNT